CLDIAAMQDFLRRHPDFVTHIRVVPPSRLRAAIAVRARGALVRVAVNGLFEAAPQFSARFVVKAWQGAFFGAVGAMFPMCLFVCPAGSLLGLGFFLSSGYLACIRLRFAAAGGLQDASSSWTLKTV